MIHWNDFFLGIGKENLFWNAEWSQNRIYAFVESVSTDSLTKPDSCSSSLSAFDLCSFSAEFVDLTIFQSNYFLTKWKEHRKLASWNGNIWFFICINYLKCSDELLKWRLCFLTLKTLYILFQNEELSQNRTYAFVESISKPLLSKVIAFFSTFLAEFVDLTIFRSVNFFELSEKCSSISSKVRFSVSGKMKYIKINPAPAMML